LSKTNTLFQNYFINIKIYSNETNIKTWVVIQYCYLYSEQRTNNSNQLELYRIVETEKIYGNYGCEKTEIEKANYIKNVATVD
jgi:hypothetical protein